MQLFSLMRLAFLAALLAVMMPIAPSFAVNPDEMLKDAKLEARAREISAGLRCLVCQNQSIDDSDAPLAKDLRVLVRERLLEGDSNEEAMDFLVSRYGEFVLLKPRFSMKTLLLWGFGPAILILGLLAVHLLYRKNKKVAETAQVTGSSSLSEEEQLKLNKILSDQDKS
ncbi:MAG: cytochrome c-type biogenesis protein CcmH [Cohaesibacter sp.]|nr:cytochrome c-type biogenesis protein CcmH [Cohaesibacter sp.]MCV6602962.1 cytochrome c-type biogenesis protein CcmH [Cohaesibacter sp.]